MNKLKNIFKLERQNPRQQLEQKPQNQKPKTLVRNTQPCQMEQQKISECQLCKRCIKDNRLHSKYLSLIKLLKIKISKLQKQAKLSQIEKLDAQMQNFQDFKMELNSASLVTLDNESNKIIGTKKIDYNKQPVENEALFDKTVKISQRIIGRKIKKKSDTKFVSELKILEEQLQNHKQNEAKLGQKIINSPQGSQAGKKCDIKSKDQVKSVSFIQLMQKSSLSIKSSKQVLLKSNSKGFDVSSIKCIDLNSGSNSQNIFSGSLQADINKKVTQKQIRQMAQRYQMLEKRNILLQKKVNLLSATIMDLKSFLMHVRHSIYQFVRMADIKHLKRGKKAFYMLNVIIKIFQYSEDEMLQMFKTGEQDSTRHRLHSLLLMTMRR